MLNNTFLYTPFAILEAVIFILFFIIYRTEGKAIKVCNSLKEMTLGVLLW